MGCCESGEQRKLNHINNNKNKTSSKQGFLWNQNQLQASSFSIDDANIRLASKKNMPHRICTYYPFPQNYSSVIKVRYVNFSRNGSFSIGVFQFEDGNQNVRISKVGLLNVIRLYVSKNLGELKVDGKVVFNQEEWKTTETDTIVLNLNLNTNLLEWRKENTLEALSYKIELPQKFQSKNLYLELIMYEPDMELNFQAGGQ